MQNFCKTRKCNGLNSESIRYNYSDEDIQNLNQQFNDSLSRKFAETRLSLAEKDLNKLQEQRKNTVMQERQRHNNVKNLKRDRDRLQETMSKRRGFTKWANVTLDRMYRVFAPESAMEHRIKMGRAELSNMRTDMINKLRQMLLFLLITEKSDNILTTNFMHLFYFMYLNCCIRFQFFRINYKYQILY